jgi:hypothetical protein
MLGKTMSCSPDKFGTKPYVDRVKKIKVVVSKVGRRNTLVLSQIK